MILEPRDHRETVEAGHVVGGPCLNCGEQVVGNYCHRCGQYVGEHNQGIWQFVTEFFEEFIRVDSKFLRTIVPLVIKPGFLTKQWVAGKRVRYITPLKLYVSLSAICFLVISLTTHPNVIHVDSNDKQSLDAARSAMDERTEKSKSPFERAITQPFKKFTVGGPEGERLAQEFSEKFMGRLSTANLILLPLFALLFKLLYIRRSRFYVEHLVFALHYYAFFSIGTTLVVLLSQVRQLEILNVPVILWMLVYLPIAMFVNYQQGIIKTFIKCWIFCSVYLVTVGVVLVCMVVLTANELDAKSPLPSAAPSKQSLKAPSSAP